MKVLIDKFASVVKNANLPDEVEVSAEINSVEGAIIVAKVMEDKKIYNNLELVSGRLSSLHKGDVIAVALGNRRALKGFVGNVPESLKAGDIINVLNLGGVAGVVTSENIQEVGHALDCEVLGVVVDGEKQLNINQFKKFEAVDSLDDCAPLIVVSGTCMNVGKTSVAGEIIKYLHRNKKTVYGTKLAGVAALRDTDTMQDFGAKKAVSFVDAGLASTAENDEQVVAVAKGALKFLSQDKPDYIVIEFGDGVYGEYGVLPVLQDPEIQKHIVAHVGCAHDPMGAAKLVEVAKEIGAPVDAVSGPVTDNSVGSSFVSNKLKIPAVNALTDSKKLFDHLPLK